MDMLILSRQKTHTTERSVFPNLSPEICQIFFYLRSRGQMSFDKSLFLIIFIYFMPIPFG